MMQFVRDSDAVGAIIAGAGSRPAEELVTALRKGGYLRKYGRRGKPKLHWFRLSHDDRELVWDSSNGKVRSIPLLSVTKIVQGQTTAVFRRDPLPDYEAVSFSLLYLEGRGSSKERSLDVVCKNTQEFDTWFLGIQLVIVLNQNVALQQHLAAANGQVVPALQASTSGSGSATPLRKQPSFPLSPRQSEDRIDKMQEFRQIAASLQPVKAALTGASQRNVSSQVALQAKREIGDCFIWGSWSDAECAGLDVCEGVLQCSALPTMVANTHALDIIQVAVGSCHAALVTRGGEVYTWGAGLGGNMGNGTGCGSNYPQQVTRLAGKGTAAVACGHTYTAAVLGDGSLHLWGSGLGGQLGLGPAVSSAVWPTRVMMGLEGVRVCQVSCGPYHAAAVGSDGRLFTWGDGLFGKLGHGDHCSAYTPRFVTTLAEHWVISVSCGWWHTAAAAVARSRLSARGVNSSASLDSYISDADSIASGAAINRSSAVAGSGSFLRGNIVGSGASISCPLPQGSAAAAAAASSGYEAASAASAMASRATDMGGAIFTWGGDFKWQQPWAKDTHQGCLGVGDLNGRLVPTLVKGEDNHVQVACGLNFTVALTTNGEVYQMGNTGAVNNKERDKADWKSALVPVLVRGLLSSHAAEQLACGMSHVAVVATQRSKTSSSSSNAPPTRLLTWGRNAAGQLGIGMGREDHFMPQVVSAVAGRRVLFLACGGNYTLAVCEHDPRARWSRDSIDHDCLAPAASGTLVSASGPSRMHLAAAAMGPTGITGAPAAALDRMDRTYAAAGGTAAAGVGTQRAGGAAGLPISPSLTSLASSVHSGSRGEAGGGGSGGGVNSGLSRKSDRGRLETRLSDRGLQVHAGHVGGSGSSREQHHGHMLASKSMGVLTRSLDRSLGGLALSGGGVAPVPQQHQQHVTAVCDARSVSWAPSPTDPSSSRSLRGLGNHSSKNLGGSLSSGPSLSCGNSTGAGLQLQDLSLQALASVTKRSHLPLPKSFKRLAMGRSDSNNSSRQAPWTDWQSQNSSGRESGGTRGPGGGGGNTPKEHWSVQGRSSLRQMSYSARSEADLATVSATSSMTSAALSVTPSPSVHSMQEGRGPDAGREAGQGTGDTAEWQRQLRYWQERAVNMEQQLSRRTHELESLRRELRFSSTSQGTGSDTPHHYSSCSSLRPQSLSEAHSSSGGAVGGGGGGTPDAAGTSGNASGSSSLAARRGLQPPAPVSAAVRFAEEASSSDRLGVSSTCSAQTAGGLTGSATVTPADESSGASSATAAAAVAAACGAGAAAAAGRAAAGAAATVAGGSGGQAEQQKGPQLQLPGSYDLTLEHSMAVTCSISSPDSSMHDAQEEWATAAHEAEPQQQQQQQLQPPESPSAASTASVSTSAATNTSQGTGSPVLHRGTSLANWVGGDAGRAALLRSRALSLANNGASVSCDSEAKTQPHQEQQHSTGDSFAFAQPDKQQQQQQRGSSGAGGLQALREAASFSSSDEGRGNNGSSGSGSRARQRQRKSSHKHQPPDAQQQQQQQQQDMFRGMSEHSKEASRVLALFQESQRHRQLLDQQAAAGTPAMQAAANSRDSMAAAGRGNAGSAGVAAGAPVTAAGGVVDGQADDAVGMCDAVAAVGPVQPLDVDGPCAVDAGLAPTSLRELEALREQNRLLQQQLLELRQQQPLAAALPAPVTVVAGRSSLGPSTSNAGALSSSLSKHRRTHSVDIGSSTSVVHEVAKGVYLSLTALPDGGYELKRVRFAKQMFSSEDAEQWWLANRERIYAACGIQQQQQQQQAGMALWQLQSPEQQQPSGVQQAVAGSTASRPLVSLANPHPLGAPAANAPTLSSLRELHAKRSSNGDWTPPSTSPCINSPQSSTLELEMLQLPPSMLLDEAFAAAQQGTAAAGQQPLAGLQQQQQQQQQLRGWAAVAVTADSSVLRSSSLGGPAVDVAVAGGSSRLLQLPPQQAELLDAQGLLINLGGNAAQTPPASSTGAEAGWTPVLPRKGSLGAAGATGPDTPAGLSVAGLLSSSHGHKRTGSGLFRWLSKTGDGSTAGSSGSQ